MYFLFFYKNTEGNHYMQINRLFGIISVLLRKGRVTAKELSERFEVSIRTIYRDIDVLSSAGIPIYTTQGKGGGISLLDEYVLDRQLVSEEEQFQILSALESIQEVEQHSIEPAMEKLSGLFKLPFPNWIAIDFSDWSETKQELYLTIKQAILKKKVLRFEYYNSIGEKTIRMVEPFTLWFKSSAWYLRAWCLTKQEIRIFKLTRMKQVKCLEKTFTKRELIESIAEGRQTTASSKRKGEIIEFTLWIDKSQAFRVYDDFEEHEIIKQPDGSFFVRAGYIEDEWVYSFIFSYSCYAKVVEPEELKQKVADRLNRMLVYYKER